MIALAFDKIMFLFIFLLPFIENEFQHTNIYYYF